MTMLHFSLYIEIKYVLVKHVCFACFVPFNESVINSYFGGEWETQDISSWHFFSISGFLISPFQDCILLFSPDKLKSSTATKIDAHRAYVPREADLHTYNIEIKNEEVFEVCKHCFVKDFDIHPSLLKCQCSIYEVGNVDECLVEALIKIKSKNV